MIVLCVNQRKLKESVRISKATLHSMIYCMQFENARDRCEIHTHTSILSFEQYFNRLFSGHKHKIKVRNTFKLKKGNENNERKYVVWNLV